MLRQNCSCRKDIETHKIPTTKEKLEFKLIIWQKQVIKVRFLVESADIRWLQ